MNGSKDSYLQDFRFDTRDKDETTEIMFKDIFSAWADEWITVVADNAFPSVVLLEWCLRQKINLYGTARTTSGFPYELLAKGRDMKDRGQWDYMMAPSDTPGRSLLCALWHDSALVKLMSNCHGPTEATVSRRVRAAEPLDVTCPSTANEYNHHMGGTDGFDGARGHFSCRRISKKWWHSVHYFI